MTKPTRRVAPFFERATGWIGSPASFAVHTVAFGVAFALPLLHFASWATMLLVLTTVVSLEAIYLAIFIQMAVNRQARELQAVSQDVDEIQEDIDEIQEDVDEIQEDIEEISVDEADEVAEEAADQARKQKQIAVLNQLTNDVQRVLDTLDTLKKGK